MRILTVILAIVLSLFLTSACTTGVVDSLQSKQDVLIESIPSGSKIYMNGDLIGTTPMVLNLQSDTNHEIYFEKEGFKRAKNYLNTVYKHAKKPYVQFGLAKDLGYYYRLSTDHLIIELDWEALPDTVGITPFESMSALITKAENALSNGSLSVDEHKVVLRQVVELFNSN